MPSAADNISKCVSASFCRVTWVGVVILDSQAMLCEYKMLFKASNKSFLLLVTVRARTLVEKCLFYKPVAMSGALCLPKTSGLFQREKQNF